MATTAASLAAWLELGELVEPDPRIDWLDTIVAAVVELLEDRCTIPEGGWSSRQELAGLMIGARLYRRRMSPEGREGFDPVALGSVVATDPDIGELLVGSEHLTGFG
jgi:hypothetical protein